MKHLVVVCLFFLMLSTSALAQQYKYHIVEQGETVESVARKYSITKETIYQYNPDARNGIRPGSKLVVPIGGENVKQQDEVEFKEHRVKRQETIWRLSQDYNVSEEDIKRYNKHLYSEELRRGEVVRIPVSLQKVTEVPSEKFQVQERPRNPMNLSAKEHVVLPKEGRYAISRKYNITIEELNRLNPGVDELHPGMVLKVSNGSAGKAIDVEGNLFKYYLVEPQETIFTLTRELGVSKDSLVALNPALTDGLKAGMVLKVPNIVPRRNLDYASEEDIVNLESRIRDYEPKNLVVMLPFNLNEINTTDTTTNARSRIKRDKVLQISLDFYSGVLMAVDSAKALGLSTNVRIFDTRQDVRQVENIINTNDFSRVDAVIGPILQSTAEAAARKLAVHGVPVISPLTKKETSRLNNFYQTRPTDEMLADAMISYLSENANGKNIIIISDASSADRKRRLMSSLPSAKVVDSRGSSISQGQVASALDRNRPNWIVLEASSIGVLSNATSYLSSISDAYDITLFTTNKGSFDSDNISNRHLSKLNFHYPSVDKEFSKDLENQFISKYKKEYGVIPNRYAVRGFDVTYDVLLRMASAENLEESMEEGFITEYVENRFNYGKNSTGGYMNQGIYIMAFGGDMELNVVRR